MTDQLSLFANVAAPKNALSKDEDAKTATKSTSASTLMTTASGSEGMFLHTHIPSLHRIKAQNPLAYNLAVKMSASYSVNADANLCFYTFLLLGDGLTNGHVCVDLHMLAGTCALSEYDVNFRFPEYAEWSAWLSAQDFVQLSALDSASEEGAQLANENAGGYEGYMQPWQQKPMVHLYKHLLYFSKWADREQRLAAELLSRSAAEIDVELDVVATLASSSEPDWQSVAVANSLLSPLSIIVGGPGTGKTTTVANILKYILLTEGHAGYRIALAAPTGKAAARMAAALGEKVSGLNMPAELARRLPDKALTLHRLLGWSVHKRQFQHHRHNPLLVDCLVVDEVSMIDLTMFVALLEALPIKCRIILLGDPYQLASVSAGDVLSAICCPSALNNFGSNRMQRLTKLFPELATNTGDNLSALAAVEHPVQADKATTDHPIALADNIVLLRKSFRFVDTAGIGLLAQACLQGDNLRLQQALSEAEVSFMDKNDHDAAQKLKALLVDHYESVAAAASVDMAFTKLAEFQLLCAVKEGDFSTHYYNQLLQRYVLESEAAKAIYEHPIATLYHGMPVMMERNHHGLGLFNGDMGLAWFESGQLWLYFMRADGQLSQLLPAQIQGWVPAHAITVHKSQGSEYLRVAFVAPEPDSPLLNREMFYTALTRSKEHFYCLAQRCELEQAITTPSERYSGLAERLEQGVLHDQKKLDAGD